MRRDYCLALLDEEELALNVLYRRGSLRESALRKVAELRGILLAPIQPTVPGSEPAQEAVV